MSEFEQLLKQAQEAQIFRPLDLRFARLVENSGSSPGLLAAACLSAGSGEGHVCLPLSLLQPDKLFSGRQLVLVSELWQAAGAPQEPQLWKELLSRWNAVSDGSLATPLVLDNDRLYLHRMWHQERQVAGFFSADLPAKLTEPSEIRTILDRLFGEEGNNWQKIAAAVALTRQHSVISGGPGTGKTTTVARLLAALLLLEPQRLRICLAAPTGKAAARLTESLGKALQALPVSDELKSRFPQEATTLHRLLGARPGTRSLRYHAGNPLHLDVLVVDEASMVDLSMMASLISALPPTARVIFLGDRDQLASVEAGAVLGDICRCAEYGYSPQRARELSELTGASLNGTVVEQAPAVRDSLCLLRQSYRFSAGSGIGQLAAAVNQGDLARLDAIRKDEYQDIALRSLASADDWLAMLGDISDGYAGMLEMIRQQSEPEDVLQAFSRYQLLCALREGPFGVSGLNQRIEQRLRQQKRLAPANGQWYSGRPVMITRNDSALGLFNGDIGITMADSNGQLKVYFMLPEGDVKAVQPSRLPPHDTAWAMTVHKSQGSEFDHTALVLPPQFSPVLSRELVYTAITRARKQLTIYSDESLFNRAVQSRTLRRSGLSWQLAQPQV
ncbi:exodeoxyribonuclease V subunit alpha [Tatumella citrea]|uniref:RecBCD enzyme subunit RecD n=1 Tax=Tatumella citrea TaxID=53336 RepID=A0A1Y0L533_TATCI|nr:exodeoxyribonuclease V subunit alpha [Tatumella citrea]ARU93123.1 exodeoxyribonuclease V subunit alpha [Tatumella citrea]ARU97161.1 exodeoxyribonuclease V subunit alpha [Tatumella citrea]